MPRPGMCSNNLNYLQNRRAKYISRILKLLEHTYFYISYTCVECGNDVMSYFASGSSQTEVDKLFLFSPGN